MKLKLIKNESVRNLVARLIICAVLVEIADEIDKKLEWQQK